MANPVRGEAELNIPGQGSFLLVLDMEALIEAEAAYGKPMTQMMKDAQAGFVGAVRAVFLGSLSAYHPSVTKSEATELLREHGDLIGAALAKAGELAWPSAKKGAPAGTEGGDNPNPPGKTSGQTGAKRVSTRKSSGVKRPELTD